jgi:DNA-binding NarL/FixJ family response regulator
MGGPEHDVPAAVVTGSGVPGGGSPVRVLVCDGHDVLRRGLRTVLRRAPDLVVVGEAADVDEALILAAGVAPDVTLLGLDTRRTAVQELVRTLSRTGNRVVLMGEAAAGSDVVEVLKAGARGYVHAAVSSCTGSTATSGRRTVRRTTRSRRGSRRSPNWSPRG